MDLKDFIKFLNQYQPFSSTGIVLPNSLNVKGLRFFGFSTKVVLGKKLKLQEVVQQDLNLPLKFNTNCCYNAVDSFFSDMIFMISAEILTESMMRGIDPMDSTRAPLDIPPDRKTASGHLF